MEAGGGRGAHGHDRRAVRRGAFGAMEREPVEEEEEEEEEEEVACTCCGFTEECMAPYITGVRARYGGQWICGLCGDVVGKELGRTSPPISPAEALDRHARVCRQPRGLLLVCHVKAMLCVLRIACKGGQAGSQESLQRSIPVTTLHVAGGEDFLAKKANKIIGAEQGLYLGAAWYDTSLGAIYTLVR